MDAYSGKTGLILTGGGARAAYQVGVLRAVAQLRSKDAPNPFPIICGTSAGAINAAALASRADAFRQSVRELLSVWRNMSVDQIYRADTWGLMKTGARWLATMMAGGLGRYNPTSLLDHAPLAALLARHVDPARVRERVASRDLYALAVSATGYSSGQSVCFYEGGPDILPWQRARRVGRPTVLTLEHLLASSALPIIFPAVKIGDEYYGDGSMRQLAPLSPALHLGADRILVIAVGRLATEILPGQAQNGYPSFAQIAGHALSSIFLDSLEVDVERLQRINRTISIMTPQMRAQHGVELRPVEVLVISPSERIDQMALAYAHNLPRSLAFFLRGIGATRRTGSILLSYLLFDREFCRALIDLGYRDAMAKREALTELLNRPGEPDSLSAAGVDSVSNFLSV